MKKFWLGILIVSGVGISHLALAQSPCSDPIKTEAGAVRGTEDQLSQTCVWMGIPYAAAPVGELRWKAPGPAKNWDGVREADHWGPQCLQSANPLKTESKEKTDLASEDCLYLNIWRPSKAGKLPVMIWIHGGGYTLGSGKYPGGRLAEFGEVMVVTINYRLNTFGFFASPSLRSEDPNQSAGNYGSLDQASAIKWVHNNIYNFGGDPGNVTIFGESAGGWSVCTMYATALNQGMFQKAIMESGGCEASESLETGYAKAEKIAERVGCKVDDLKCLRAVPAEKLIAGGAGEILKEGFTFVNHWDGYLLKDTALSMIRSGNFNRIPLMAGSTKEEVNFLVLARPRLNHALPGRYEKLISRNFNLSPEQAQKVSAAYPLSQYENKPKVAFGYIFTDLALACPTYLGLDSASALGVPTYYYRFDYRGMKGGNFVKAFHSSEIPFVFNSLDQSPFTLFYDEKNLGPAQGLSKTIQGYWTNFAKTGNPNGQGLPEWPKYQPNDQSVQILNLQVRTEKSDMDNRCEVWDGYNKTHRPIFETLARKEKK